MEGGIRVPTVIRWPSVIPPGRSLDQPTSQMDLFSTIAYITQAQLPGDRSIDGKISCHLYRETFLKVLMTYFYITAEMKSMRPELRPKTVSDQLVITLNKFKTVGHSH